MSNSQDTKRLSRRVSFEQRMMSTELEDLTRSSKRQKKGIVIQSDELVQRLPEGRENKSLKRRHPPENDPEQLERKKMKSVDGFEDTNSEEMPQYSSSGASVNLRPVGYLITPSPSIDNLKRSDEGWNSATISRASPPTTASHDSGLLGLEIGLDIGDDEVTHFPLSKPVRPPIQEHWPVPETRPSTSKFMHHSPIASMQIFTKDLTRLDRGLLSAGSSYSAGFTVGAHVKASHSSAAKSRTRFQTVVHDVALLFVMLLSAYLLFHVKDIVAQTKTRLEFPNQDCIYVSGGGFSGFWFSLGRLETLRRDKHQRMSSQRFACYSAGCLGVVSVYANHSMEDLYDMASTLQKDWQKGNLNRFHVVEDFIDQLMDGKQFDPDVLNSLHILTSVPESLGFRAVMRTPADVEELRLLLRQTTWIPLAVGSQYTFNGHLDGAFSLFQHPQCRKNVGLANYWKLLMNTLNVNLQKQHVEEFWKLGLEYGI